MHGATHIKIKLENRVLHSNEGYQIKLRMENRKY
jgi:hypothetical protein